MKIIRHYPTDESNAPLQVPLLENEDAGVVHLEIPVPMNNRPLSILSERKFGKNYQKFKAGADLKKGLHFGCRYCAVAGDVIPLCGMQPAGRCMCHRMRMIKPDGVGINEDDRELVWMPSAIHNTYPDEGREWVLFGVACYRLEVHKCTTCGNIIARRYIHAGVLEKCVGMTPAGSLGYVDAAPEQYFFITHCANLHMLKEETEEEVEEE